MGNYKYHCKGADGKDTDGEIEALNEKDAVKKLQSQGLFVIAINPKNSEANKPEDILSANRVDADSKKSVSQSQGGEPEIGKRKCPFCAEEIQNTAIKCKHCGEFLNKSEEVKAAKIYDPKTKSTSPQAGALILFLVLLFVFAGFFRIYYGGGIGLRIVLKDGFSFSDTLVNLNDIMGMPRIAVASKHPAVKLQLEKMGIVQTDEQVQEKMMSDITQKSKEMMRNIEKELQY